MTEMLTFNELKNAVTGTAAAFRCRTILQPAGGPGDKVFPPTYAGAVYATEKRRLPGREEPVDCVLLDSVQSQANRMEEALQQAVDEGTIKIPVIEVDFNDLGLLTEIGKITSLQAPHRIADAILRDSLLGEQAFRKSDVGNKLDSVSLWNATPLYQLCPTALIFGMWDSAGRKGGLGAKFARAIVSEIVGIDAVLGVKTSSRIDPLQIQRNAGPLYRTADDSWTLNPDEAVDEIENKNGRPTGKKLLYKKSKGKDVYYNPQGNVDKLPDCGRPSKANHGNIVPDIDCRCDQNNNPIKDEDGKRIPVGGVTLSSIEHMIVLSLPALRRLHFPISNGGDTKKTNKTNIAGRTVLAALGLCAATLAAENGYDLRSRCVLWPTESLTWEILGKPGAPPRKINIDSENAISILDTAIKSANELGLKWREAPLVLKPSKGLIDLVKKSQKLAAQSDDAEGDE